MFPETAFVGRTTTVEVTGTDTDWGSGVTVDFGEGVTVNAVTVVSPTALQAEIDVAANVALGAADVSVSGTDTGPGLLEFLSPVSVEISTFEQGGFGSIIVTNLDLLHPFDTETDEDGNFINLDVTNGDESVQLFVADATPDTITLSAVIDVNATGTGDITLSASDGTTPNTTIIAPQAVTARTPALLGPTQEITVLDNGTLFEVTATELAMLHIRMDSQDAFVPALDILPASGKWSEEVGFQAILFSSNVVENRVAMAGEKFYVIVSDFAGGGYSATLTSRTIPLAGATQVTDTEPNNTAATGNVAAGTVVQFNGTLADDADKDCFRVTTTGSQKIHVFTTDEGGMTDTLVEVFDANNTTLLEPEATSTEDFGSPEDVVTAPVTGTRAVCISTAVGATNSPYKAFVVFDAP